jgi:hypothetical protein
MRKASIGRGLLVGLAVGVAAALLVPTDALDRALALLTGAASGPTSDHEVSVSLTFNGHSTYEYKAALSRDEVSRTESSPERAKDEFVTRAKQALARTQGYDSKTYGADSYKILSGVKINWVRVKDIRSGRSTDIFRTARRGDPADLGVMD